MDGFEVLQELKRHRDHLEEIVAVRTKDLQKANEELLAEITERKRAKEQLLQSEKNYRILAENPEGCQIPWIKPYALPLLLPA